MLAYFTPLWEGVHRKKTRGGKTPKDRFSSPRYGQVCSPIPDLLSRRASMLFENQQHAANVSRPDLRILHPAPPQRASDRLSAAATGVRSPLPPHASRRAQPGVLRPEPFLARCCHRGCVFPAQPGGCGECGYHRRQSLEPDCFASQQPSFLLLDQAKFGLPDSEPDDSRVRDRHRLASERVRFMLGEAA
jgi:hypothetical protein